MPAALPDADAPRPTSPATECVLAVDLGTGGPKVGLVAENGVLLASASEPVSLHLLPGGGAEQDPEEWWAAISRAARRALERAPVTPSQVVGVGCTAQWSGTVAVDGDGAPLRPAVIWMDSRGSTAIRRQMRGRVSVMGYGARKLQRWVRLTGGAPGRSGKDPTAHILWLREAEPEVYARAWKFLEPVDWLNLRLTGTCSASYDSIAAHWVTDNRRIDAVDYDATLLAMAGLERATLPDLVPPATILGTLTPAAADALGLMAGIPVATGTGDVHSAAVGSGAVQDYAAHLYIGTSSWISCHVPFKKTDAMHNVASIPAAIPGRYLVADEHETAGACLTFVAETLFAGEDGGPVPRTVYGQLDDIAEKVPAGAHGVIFTPWLNGERSPVDDHTIRAGFHNLSLSSTRRDMVRAVYEGVALNSRWLLDAVEKFAGRTFDELAFIGGGANSAVWAQIHADVTGRRIRPVVEPVLANVRGAGLLTLLAMGRVRVTDMPAMVESGRTYEPDSSHAAVYDAHFREFVTLYKETKQIHRRLNGH